VSAQTPDGGGENTADRDRVAERVHTYGWHDHGNEIYAHHCLEDTNLEPDAGDYIRLLQPRNAGGLLALKLTHPRPRWGGSYIGHLGTTPAVVTEYRSVELYGADYAEEYVRQRLEHSDEPWRVEVVPIEETPLVQRSLQREPINWWEHREWPAWWIDTAGEGGVEP
jgi:hypothetical protein